MRIIGGEDAGRRLKRFGGREIRPTPDRVREAVFSALGSAVRGAKVLDLFAGTGALGLEALSRGASEVVFVDSSPRSADIIRQNLVLLGRLEQGRVLLKPAHAALAGALKGRFHLIFSDPPYKIDLKYLQGIYLSILERDLLEPGGLLVAEGPVSREPAVFPGRLEELGRKKYGDTAVDFYRLVPSEEKGG